MGRLDESERVRTKGSRAHRRPWPLSARLLVGALFVLNTLLAAFLVRTEIERPRARAISTPFRPGQLKPSSAPQVNAPPDQGSNLDQRSSRDLNFPPVEAKPSALSGTRTADHLPIRTLPKSLQTSKPSRGVWSPPRRGSVIYPPHEAFIRTPDPVDNPAASSSASVSVAPLARAASVGIPGAGVRSNAELHSREPAASGLDPSAIGHGTAAKAIRSAPVATVASVRLPAMETGLVAPKRPVAPAGIKVEIIPRPAVKLDNCGDDKVFVACPTLQIRYDTPYTSEDR